MKPAQQYYIALSEYDFGWIPRDVERVAKLWDEGVHVCDMSHTLRRPIVEIAILVMDLAERGVIKNRPGGAKGER